MDARPIPPTEAADALVEVQARRDQVVTGTLTPVWYWPTLGALFLVLNAAIETRRPWVVVAGSIACAAGFGAILARIMARRPVQVHNAMIGVRGGLAIAAFTVVLVGLNLGLSFGLQANDVPRPVTIAAVATAACMAVGGPLLMRYLRGLMRRRPVGGR